MHGVTMKFSKGLLQKKNRCLELARRKSEKSRNFQCRENTFGYFAQFAFFKISVQRKGVQEENHLQHQFQKNCKQTFNFQY